MESILPTTSFSSSSSSSKSDRRSKSKSTQTSSKPSLVMALISCFAWLYVAGRLWQDAENRVLLATLFKKNSQQNEFSWGREVFEYCEVLLWCLDDREDPIVTVFGNALEANGERRGNPSSPFTFVARRSSKATPWLQWQQRGEARKRPKMLTVEDKLMVLGCKDLERRIVEVEMELTVAKSHGYLQNQLKQSGSSSGKQLLAVIGIYTGFGGRLRRNVIRGSWFPNVDALSKLEERGVVVRFVIGRSPNRGDSLDRNINEENRATKDFLILGSHEEAHEELPKKAKYFFSSAIQTWDAEFYVKVDDNIDVDLDGLIELLQKRRGQDSSYIGCMKSGEVVSEEGKSWYEPEWWKFGDEKLYFRHAAGSVLVLSKNLAQYININRVGDKIGSTKKFSHLIYADDTIILCEPEGEQLNYIRLILILFEAVSGRKHEALEIWDGIIENAESKLSRWKTQYLSLGGRVILINSFLDSLPTYVMSLFPIPPKVVKKLDKLGRTFLWKGEKEKFGNPKQHPFNEVVVEVVSEPYGWGVWGTIRALWNNMEENVLLKVGNGNKNKFRRDGWIDQIPLSELLPDLYSICNNTEARVYECWTTQGWDLSFRRLLNVWEVYSVASLH
ncbi:hypothetical protein H5410_041261 [Solanum commersonii]|uniref:Hexosyltransferase n=1 Tax=Solanum commersonii TaxID=4109 RepID=A0A9J5XR29_SOLCO|nr:hypothetical protein H5410_041261 [Solanum commersonii]